jgi:hypothetical protein
MIGMFCKLVSAGLSEKFPKFKKVLKVLFFVRSIYFDAEEDQDFNIAWLFEQ